MYFVVVDIGCIECGQATSVLGIFNSISEADKVKKDHEKRQKENWNGQHYFEIFAIEELNKEYRVEYGNY